MTTHESALSDLAARLASTDPSLSTSRRDILTAALQELIEAELTATIGAAPGERHRTTRAGRSGRALMIEPLRISHVTGLPWLPSVISASFRVSWTVAPLQAVDRCSTRCSRGSSCADTPIPITSWLRASSSQAHARWTKRATAWLPAVAWRWPNHRAATGSSADLERAGAPGGSRTSDGRCTRRCMSHCRERTPVGG